MRGLPTDLIFCARTGFFSPPRPPSRSALKKATRFRSRWVCACSRCRSPECWEKLAGSDLRLRPGADAERLAGRLRAEMPPGTLVERPDADLERSGALSRAYRVNLNVLALVALFTGGLLVFSAQALAVVRRRAQLALLRVLGM